MEDELARTATAPGSASGPASPIMPVGETLGRYKLERQLGVGGMGVVYAAFDPDLERRVALKVLRSVDSGEGRQRLLREARAMARLSHGNVVAVHEVGSASGRDFVAMELVDGETLADWLRLARVPERVVDAFIAAGRGLAAAHRAGLVHRDFKPHNVLRSRDGRILVTDFGLARGVDTPLDPLAKTVQPGTPVSESSSSLTGITITGSVLGTPAYMAPEQWHGGTASPATDQFAFCVALWEALAGARPYRGDTVEALRNQVERGPGELDAGKLPRNLRAALRRGLDPDPKRRWPSMDALIARIDPGARRRDRWATVALGSVAGAIVAVGLAVAVAHRASAPPACETRMDPSAVWPAGAKDAIAAQGQRPASIALDADVQRWRDARGAACTAPESTPRRVELDCLDHVLARLDIVARAVEKLRGHLLHVDAGALLVDPAVCKLPRVPRLTLAQTPELAQASELCVRDEATDAPPARDQIVELATTVANDPCASAIAHRLALEAVTAVKDRRAHLEAATQAAERCGDDRLIADLDLVAARNAMSREWLGDELVDRIKLADSAIQPVQQPDLAAELDALRMYVAARTESVDAAMARGEAAMTGFAARGRTARQIATAKYVLGLRRARGRADDLASYSTELASLRALAVDRLGEDDDLVRGLDLERSNWQFSNGDVAGAHAQIAKLRRERPNDNPRRIGGRVVDASGAPVAGATVVVGPSLVGTPAAAAEQTDHDRTAITGADGRFAIAGAPKEGVAVAELGDRRAWAVAIADDIQLVLEPTSRVQGTVDLRGVPAQNAFIEVDDATGSPLAPYTVQAPIAADGTFTVDGLPRRPLRVSVSLVRAMWSGRYNSFGKSVVVDKPAMAGVELALSMSKRVVYAIVRSTVGTPVANAQVIIVPGTKTNMTALELTRSVETASSGLALAVSEHAPPSVIQKAHSGDLYVTISNAPEGEASACAIGLPQELADEELWRKVMSNLDKIEVRCQPVTDDVVIVEVPPWPRLD